MGRGGGRWLLALWISLLTACAPPPGFQLPDDPLARILGRRVGRIILLGTDGNLYLTDISGIRRHALTRDAGPMRQGHRSYWLPIWSPDGKHLAVFEQVNAEIPTTRVIHLGLSPEGPPVRQVWGEWKGEEPVLLGWLDARSLFVLNRGSGRSRNYILRALDTESQREAVLAQGDPLFFSWNAVRRVLAWHREGRYLELRVLDEGAVERRSDHTAAFNAPAWSPDGQWLAWAEQEGNTSVLRLENLERSAARTVVTFTGGVAFSWSPTGRYLALITDPTTTVPRIGPLDLYDIPADRLTRLGDQPHLAMFWSRDGTRLLAFRLLEIDPASGQALLQARVYEPSGASRELGTFIPTFPFLNLLSRFDVFQGSAFLWSPDDRFVLIAAAEPGGKAGIYALHVSGWLEPRRLGDGVLAFYSPW
mgnify:CR=1 FL=1